MDDDTAKPLSDLLEPGSTLMVGVESAAFPLEFRPLTVAKVSGSRIEILLDTSEPWAKAIGTGDRTFVTLSDNRSNTWVSLRGTVSTTTDPAAIDELWNPFADAYFDEGRETPGITVLRIEGDEGRYWTTPSGRLGSLISVVRAKLGDAEDSGEQGAVAI